MNIYVVILIVLNIISQIYLCFLLYQSQSVGHFLVTIFFNKNFYDKHGLTGKSYREKTARVFFKIFLFQWVIFLLVFVIAPYYDYLFLYKKLYFKLWIEHHSEALMTSFVASGGVYWGLFQRYRNEYVSKWSYLANIHDFRLKAAHSRNSNIIIPVINYEKHRKTRLTKHHLNFIEDAIMYKMHKHRSFEPTVKYVLGELASEYKNPNVCNYIEKYYEEIHNFILKDNIYFCDAEKYYNNGAFD